MLALGSATHIVVATGPDTYIITNYSADVDKAGYMPVKARQLYPNNFLITNSQAQPG